MLFQLSAFQSMPVLSGLRAPRTPEEFSSKLEFAMKHDPHPMKEEERRRLTWEAATERFLDVSELKGEERSPPVSAAIDTLAFNLHNYLTGAGPLPLPQSCAQSCTEEHITIQASAVLLRVVKANHQHSTSRSKRGGLTSVLVALGV